MELNPRITVEEHLRHMYDGHWHDNCFRCLKRRREGGDGLYPEDREQRVADSPPEETR